MNEVKKNVAAFNANVADNGGYVYTTNAPLSSQLSNQRISDEVHTLIQKDVKIIFDIGCGDGVYTAELAKRNPGASVVGFDAAQNAIDVARRNFPNVKFTVSDICQDAPLGEGRADVVVLRGLLHHVSNPQAALQNARRLSSRMIIVEPNGNNPLLKIIEKISRYHRDHEEQSFSSRTLRSWCEESGWQVVSLDYIGFIPFFFPTSLTRILYWFQPFFEKIFILRMSFGAQIVLFAKQLDQGV